VVQEASSNITITSLVAAGYGCSLGISVPGSAAPEGIKLIPILDTDLRLQIQLVWHRDNPSPALQRFLELARKVLDPAGSADVGFA
jgi:DNA-binding transcriptional LysR family regulator